MLRLARVIGVHGRRADIVCVDGDGMRFGNVPIMSPSAATDVCWNGAPTPSQWKTEDAAVTPQKRDVIALVAIMRRSPIIIGFLDPMLSQCIFDDPDLFLHRTPSDFYWSVDGDGNMQLSHPSGAFVHFGEGAQFKDLSGKDRNKTWKLDKNTDKQPDFVISLGTRDQTMLVIQCLSEGTLNVTLAKDFSLVGQGKGTMSFPGGLEITADTKIIGNMHVTKDINGDGNVSDAKGSMQEMRGYYNKHKHVETGTTTNIADTPMT